MSVPLVKTIWEVLNGGGVPALLFLSIVAIVKQWIVPGWLYEAKAAECEKWQQLVMDSTGLLDRSLALAEKAKPEA